MLNLNNECQEIIMAWKFDEPLDRPVYLTNFIIWVSNMKITERNVLPKSSLLMDQKIFFKDWNKS
jgi:hypothetical protein